MLVLVGVDIESGRWDAYPFAAEAEVELEGTDEVREHLAPAILFLARLGGGECLVVTPEELFA
jgi:hypothetical protein